MEADDFSNNTKRLANGTVEELQMPNSNVLRYVFDDETWIAIRPSGTEPKLKYYVGTSDKSQAAAVAKLDQFVQDLTEFAEA